MECFPILDDFTQLASSNPNACYLMNASGDAPSARVGHACVCTENDGRPRIYFIGGANPDGSFAEMHALQLKDWKWVSYPATNFTGRYGHAAFASENYVFVFGGANVGGNLNEVQRWDVKEKVWHTVDTEGEDIAARTHHTSALVEGNKLVIFSGGHDGANPIEEDGLRVFDSATNLWSTPATNGTAPTPRQGHLMIAMDKKVYLHGGMAGNAYYDDFHILDFDTMTWELLESMDGQPSARAAHSGVTCRDKIYLFGGMNETGALNDMFSLNREEMQWTKLTFSTPPPAPRLDFAMCVLQLSLENTANPVTEGDESADASKTCSMPESPSVDVNPNAGTSCELSTFILIHGGMNTDGDIYDDCFLIRV